MSTFEVSRVLRGAVVGAALMILAGCAGGPSAASVIASNGARAHAAGMQGDFSAKHLVKVQELVNQARQEGLPDFYALVRNGQTRYCWRGRNIGTLIPSTKCVHSAATLRHVLAMMAAERHRMEDGAGVCGQIKNCYWK